MKNKRQPKYVNACLIALILLVVSCSSRKYTVKHENKAAAAADALAALRNPSLHRFVNDWIGVHYRYGGLDKRGVDCSGFTFLLEKEIYGIRLPRVSRDMARIVKRRSLEDLKEGDLVFFSFSGGDIDHVGVYLNDGFFVHASTTRGVIIDDIRMPSYQKAYVKSGTLN